jgi:hypothetical protein
VKVVGSCRINAPAGFLFAPAGAFVVSASETGAITGDMAAPNSAASMKMNDLIRASARGRRDGRGLIDRLKQTPLEETSRAVVVALRSRPARATWLPVQLFLCIR